MKIVHGFLFLFLQTLSLFSFSQKQPVKFEHIGTNSGLSQSSVLSIFQDSRGFMWFGTHEGLNKYDGYKFTVYKYNVANENSLSHNSVQGITEDAEGNLWLATWGGGLNKFDWKKEKFTRYRYSAKDSTGIGRDHIGKVLIDSEGNLWMGTEGGGLNMYDKKNNRFIRYLHDENDPNSLSDDWVKDIAEDAQHNLWIGTNTGGMNLFDKKTKTFRRFQHDERNNRSLSSDQDCIVFVDSRNQVWIGTRGGGLNLFDRVKEEFIHFKNDIYNINSLSTNVIKAIDEDEDGNLWIGTENGGLSIFSPRSGTFDNYLQDDADNTSLNQNSIWSVFRDNKGNMWVGTFSGGINLASRDRNKFTHYRHSSSPYSLNNNTITSIFEDAKENLWLGTDGGGLNLWDNKKNIFTSYKHDPLNKNSICGNYIIEVFEDSYGNLWIGTWGNGITVFNKEKNTFKHFKYDPANPKSVSSSNAWTITEDADRNVWIGTYNGGLCQYDRKNGNFINYRNVVTDSSSLSNNYVNILYSDRKGNLWIGTNGTGLDLFDKKTKTFTHFSHQESKTSISNNDVYTIAEDEKGNLWIGTGLGLNRFNIKTKQFTGYYIKDGLPGNTIAGLLFDKKGNLWISTFNGLSKFNPADTTFKNFDTNDGLQSDEFKTNSCFKSRSGRMYFGGINGFNVFFPDSIHEKKYDPPLVFTDFQIFNKQVPINTSNNKSVLKQSITDTKELVLSYSQSVISFEFASLNYTAQSKKQYSYMLEGFDKSWNDIGAKHTATYTNLDPGKYVFKVRGFNNEGKWSSSIASIKLTITPPYWKTWWFRLSVIMGIIGGVFLFYRYRIKSIYAQRTKLQRLVDEQTIQLLQSTKEEHIAREQAEQANKELEEKNRELEQFAYIASHDMQEPLRTISNFTDLVQKKYKGKIDEKADSYFIFIQQASERMRVLIKDLLDYSRIGRKKELQAANCEIILQETRADLAVAISETTTKIKSSPLPVINGYPTELKQLFQNLIINAIKFRKKNESPQIDISVQKKINHWEFAFKDNGIGIDKKHSEKIFIIFQRLYNRNEYEGSGIGLAHCKKIVELHGGRIWIESEPGQGTTFYFTISENLK